MAQLLPEGLLEAEHCELERCAARAAGMKATDLLARARDHVAETRRKAETNPLLDVQVAEALLGSIEAGADEWIRCGKAAQGEDGE
jgi:hypothetical protein